VRSTRREQSAADRATSWRGIVGELFGGHEVSLRPTDRRSFFGSLRYREIGEYGMSRIRTGPHEIMHSGPGGPGTRGMLHLNFVVDGECDALSQAGRTVRLRPGDVALDDGDQPYAIEARHGFDLMCLHIPKERIQPALRDGTAVAAVKVDASAPEAAPLGSLLRAVESLPGPDAVADRMLAEAAVGVAAAAMLRSLGSPEGSSPRDAHLRRVRAHIERELADPDLTVSEIAQATHVSVRYLHSLFADEEETVSQYLMGRRLERAARLLRDPGHDPLPVAEIGSRSGFKDSSHFGRCFARRYDITPAQYRAAGR
jgi:AraC-like DNA-binding protein